MFKGIKSDALSVFSKSMLNKIILINVVMFVATALLNLFVPVKEYLVLPLDASLLIFRPWTLITHMFMHEGFMHIFFNMLVLYWFGRMYQDIFGDRKLLATYIYGGTAAALLTVVISTLGMGGGFALGASAAVMAIVFAVCAHSPDMRINLFLIGPVKLKYIALFYLAINFIGLCSSCGFISSLAHLAGAGIGWTFALQYKRGKDWTTRFNKILGDRLYGGSVARKAKVANKKTYTVNEILDKINRRGMRSLTKEEKEFLKKHSR